MNSMQNAAATDGAEQHAVGFYESTHQLAAAVSRHLSGAIRAGGTGLAIATDAHRDAFWAELETLGLDVADLTAEGALVWLDASAVLATFMIGDHPDPTAFRRAVSATVRDAAARGQPLHVYGEMVSLLWDEGNIAAAIELEELWNDLGRQHRFSLLCGYPSSLLSDPEQVEALERVCALHSTVHPAQASHGSAGAADLPAVAAVQSFAAKNDAPRASREFIGDVLTEWGLDGVVLEDANLIVSELATNAVVHARSRFHVIVRIGASRVRLAVQDYSDLQPRPGSAGPADPRGRGLGIVADVADDWGYEPTADGKTVWAELRA